MASSLAPRDPVEYRRLQAAYQQSLRYAEDVRRLYRQLQRSVSQSLLGLASALEARDACSRGHSERVAELSRRIAELIGLDPVDVEAIEEAGLLHDIGNISVPEPTLRQPGELTEAEWEEMRRHPIVGAQIIAPFEFLAGAVPLIRYHHERWDGSGYPDGLAGAAIPLGARVVAVADVFDALTSSRPYRPALPAAAALAHLVDAAGRTLDPGVVAACVSLVRGEGR